VKVLLMAYECSPYGTSERAVGWGRLLQALRVAEVHLVTSEASHRLMQEGQASGTVPGTVRLYTPEPDARLRRLEQKPVLFAYNYTAYEHWQRLAMSLAETLHSRESFDLVHQVNVCTFREPGYTWKLGIPYIWGPVGGTQNFPARFLSMLSPREAVKEGLRGVSNWLSLRLKPRVREAARAAERILAANSTNQRDYEQVFSRKVGLLLETGLYTLGQIDRTRFAVRATTLRASPAGEPLKLVWIGELQTRKALPILLRAMSAIPEACELDVLGAGPLREAWELEAARLGLGGRVRFLGKLPFSQVQRALAQAHLFCFTSLRDTSGNVVLEALAAGVPVICFDHQGARDMVDDLSGVKIAVSTPKQAVAEWTRALRELAQDGERLMRLSEGASERARAFLWDANGDRVNALYREVTQAERPT
jgi:glycosyltransferase involved in cell wall biosynthesis